MSASKQNLSRRDFLKWSAIAGAGALVAACGPVAPGGGAEVAAPAAETTQLRIGHWWGNNMTDSLPFLEEKFNVKITEETAGWGDYWDKLLTQVVGGVAPDMMLMAPQKSGPFFVQGLLSPLDDALAVANLDESKWALDFENLRHKGQILGLPLYMHSAVGWVINVDLIEQEGFEVPHPWPFWGTPEFDNFSWDNFLANLQACTKTSADGEIEIYGSANGWSSFSPWMQLSIHENGGELFDAYDFDDTQTLINSPEAVQAIQTYTDLVVTHKVAPPVGAEAAFKEGIFRAQKGVANCSWISYNIWGRPEDIGFNWRAILLPHFGKGRRILKQADFMSANPQTSHLDLANEIVIAMVSDFDFTVDLFKRMLNIPLYDPQRNLAAITNEHELEFLKIQLARFEGFSECDYCTEEMGFITAHFGKKTAFFGDTMNTKIQEVVLGQKTVQQALDEAKTLIDEELAKP
jgi:ABC-type glycerol-3-phosphate transport system substrate-binding protein